MKRALTRLRARVGHRGAVLLFFALLDFAYAGSIAKPPAEAARSATVAFIAHVLPLPAWATLWAVAGLVLLVGAFRRHDSLAYATAAGIKTLWGGLFLFGWLLAGLDRGWVAAIVWLAMAVMLLIVATWPEPPSVERQRR